MKQVLAAKASAVMTHIQVRDAIRRVPPKRDAARFFGELCFLCTRPLKRPKSKVQPCEKSSVGLNYEQNTDTWCRGAGSSRNDNSSIGSRYPAATAAAGGGGAAGGL
jgi:hypothetical protein